MGNLRGLCAVLALIGASCGGGAAETRASSRPQIEFEETGSMRTLASGEVAPELPSRPIGTSHPTPDALSLLNARASGAPPADTRELYRRVAPGTVIVRAQDSMGTGVVVGPGGLVLTNHHVVRPAELDQFRMRVTVEYGRVGENGSMVPDGTRRTAYVLRVDRDRDLAVLRVEEPPDAPVVALAARDPGPGDNVTTIGHGTVGLVWAVRRCEVEATGRLEEQYARLAALCGQDVESAQEACRDLREQMHASMNGLVIQSSCPLTPGDSGGPLVDAQGQLVGVNVMTMRNANNQWSNFHIHAREVREFLRNVPSRPERFLTSPWIDHDEVVPLDQDLDGRWDTIVLYGNNVVARLVDLDQDSPELTLATLRESVNSRTFDAELATVSRFSDRFVWYDGDADGQLELVFTQDTRGETRSVDTVRGDQITRTDVPPGPALHADRVRPPERARFSRIFDESHLAEHPSPYPAVLRRGSLRDADGDGTLDTIHGSQSMVEAIAFDVDQSSLGGLRPDDLDAFVRGNRLDAEVSVVLREPTVWVYYDRDGNGTMDTGLRTAPSSPIVAAVVPMSGAPSPNDVIGTLAVRADWLGDRHDAFIRMTGGHVARHWVATNDDSSGLPDPVRHHRDPAVTASYTANGWENFVVDLRSTGFMTTLVDVDRSSFRGAAGRRQLEAGISRALEGDHFSADFAIISTRNGFWAYYDTNGDRRWDIVLVEVVDGENHVHNAFRRNREGVFVHDAALVQGRVIRPSLVAARHRARFAEMASDYFLSRLVEPAAPSR